MNERVNVLGGDLYIMIGCSGSGKTSFVTNFAEKVDATVISTDTIREIVNGNAADQANPRLVFQHAYHLMNVALRDGKNVIFDATNTTKDGRRELIRAAKSSKFLGRVIGVIMPVGADTALKQNADRIGRHVPPRVIRRQYDQLMRDGESIPMQCDELVFARVG